MVICNWFKKKALELPLASTVEVGHAVYTRAVSQLGLGERGSNNSGEHVEKYAAAIDRHAPLVWCAAFAYWCYVEACDEFGLDYMVKPTAGAKRLCKNIVAAGGSKVSFAQARTGDVVLWHRGAKNAWTGHVAILQSKNVAQQRFTTIEGNKGNFPANVSTFQHANGEGNLLGFYSWPRHERKLEVIA